MEGVELRGCKASSAGVPGPVTGAGPGRRPQDAGEKVASYPTRAVLRGFRVWAPSSWQPCGGCSRARVTREKPPASLASASSSGVKEAAPGPPDACSLHRGPLTSQDTPTWRSLFVSLLYGGPLQGKPQALEWGQLPQACGSLGRAWRWTLTQRSQRSGARPVSWPGQQEATNAITLGMTSGWEPGPTGLETPDRPSVSPVASA